MMKRLCSNGILSFLVLSMATLCSVASAQDSAALESDEGGKLRYLEEVIVTGVFKSTAQQGAAIAITAIGEDELQSKVAFSAADILKDVPGVFVNSALGEIRNIVYTRGISANSLDGNGGYFYVSMQEDGLPVQNALLTNFGPDYFTRPDIMTRRVEALRGGSAAITGPNAPGGTFNYLSKTGLSNPGSQISARFGSEGGGLGNPYYRADFYHGGQIADRWYYAIGGFYRDGTGARDMGYSMNHGGQIRGNLLYEYEGGSLKLDGKILRDHNLWDEFVPVSGLSSARPIGQFDYDSTVNPPRVPHCYPAIGGDVPSLSGEFPQGRPMGEDCWDPGNNIHSTSDAFGFSWEHEFGQGWSLNNRFRYSENNADWSSGAGIFSMPVTVAGIYSPESWSAGFLSVVGEGNSPLEGVISLRDRSSGAVLARLRSDGDGRYDLLPDSSLPDAPELPNAVLVQTAYAPETGADEIINQLTVSKQLNNMTFNAGAFYAKSKAYWRSGGGGTGLSQFTPDRELLDISIERADGRVQQVTSPAGFAGLGRIDTFTTFASRADQNQLSLYFGHDWQITDRLNLDWGVRYEKIKVKGFNQLATQTTDAEDGGLDGNVDTLYDNTYQELGAPIRYSNLELDYTAYSGALSYDWNARHSTYVRFASGKKAPPLGEYFNQGSAVNDAQYTPQKVRLYEIGHVIVGDSYRISVTPFFSQLDNIGGFGVAARFFNEDGTEYVPPSLLASQETLGVEVESSFDLTDQFNLRANVTLQNSESSGNAVWEPNGPGREDDEIVQLAEGDAANTAKVQTAFTGTYSKDSWSAFVTWRYMGDRPANRSNSFDLKGFHTVDVGATYRVSEALTLLVNVNNLLNEHGVLSWQGAGGFSGLNREIAPVNELWSVVHQQPRAVFLTANYKF